LLLEVASWSAGKSGAAAARLGWMVEMGAETFIFNLGQEQHFTDGTFAASHMHTAT
jgi:hypothetical protein